MSTTNQPKGQRMSSNGTDKKPNARISDEALWLWGRLKDFERMGLIGSDLSAFLKQMTPTMQGDVHRLIGPVLETLSTLASEETDFEQFDLPGGGTATFRKTEGGQMLKRAFGDIFGIEETK